MPEFRQHPLSAAFPPMSEDEYSALKADIQENGQRHPAIVIAEPDGAFSVLDGWHRVQACLDAGREPLTREYDGADPVAFVISANLHRRHLTSGQRAQAVVLCNEWVAKPGSALRAEPSGVTASQMAQQAQVGVRVIERAKQVQRADPQLAQQVVAGAVSLNAAAKQAAGEPPAAAAKRVVAAIPTQSEIEKRDTEIASLKARIDELTEALAEMTDAAEILAGIQEGKDTIEMLKASKNYARAVERTRNDLQQENARLKNEIKMLRRKYERD